MRSSILFIMLLVSHWALAQTGVDQLSDATYLRKLSLHIKGIAPTTAEYKELEQASTPEAKAAYLNQKIEEYLKSSEAQDRLIFRLSERFQVRTPGLGLTDYKAQISSQSLYSSTSSAFIAYDSLTDLFGRLSRENLPWDELVTAKSYSAYPVRRSIDAMTDFNFFKLVQPTLNDDNYISSDSPLFAPTPITFDKNDLRISGALTTPRFLSRYNTTNLNRNRRRAAAVFRIFLCDPMFPVVPALPDRKSNLLSESFSDDMHAGGEVTEKQLDDKFTVAEKDRHGSDKRCASCHYKLDPLGKTFLNIGIVLGPDPSPGMLTYKRTNGELVRKPVRGVGELGQELVKQPEYVSCQIDWFWKQFIGGDMPLSTERKAQLTQSFESVGRRTNDFIKVMVTAPEFRRKRSTRIEPVAYTQVTPMLKRCDSCHSDEALAPDAYLGHQVDKKGLLEMRHYINLPDNSRDKMPEDFAKWNVNDLNLLKRWIEEGAVNEAGERQLSADDLRSK